MNMNIFKDKSNSSSIVSVKFLALFITFAPWVFLSYPISTTVRNYFYSVNGISELISSSAHLQNIQPNGVNITDESNPYSNDENKLSVELSENATQEAKNGEDLQEIIEVGDVDVNQQKDKQRDDEGELSSSTNWQNIPPIGVNITDKSNPYEDGENKLSVEHGENTTQEAKNGEELQEIIEVGDVDVKQENKDRQRDDGRGKLDENKLSVEHGENATQESKNGEELQEIIGVGDVDIVNQENKDIQKGDEGECDLFHGEWFYDESGPLYTNNSCPIITKTQNCQGNGRPDKGYESWRWRPSQCVLPRFDPHKFLELMSGKTIAFVGDSIARNQMESLLCILWQVEVPKNQGSRFMQRWLFRSKQMMIVRIWSSWLVHVTGDAFKDAPGDVAKVFLDVPDEKFMAHAHEFDVLVLSSGHWFVKQSIYIKNNEIVGTQLWAPPNGRQFPVNNVEAYEVSVETAITALATHPNFTGIAILRSYSPDHYEGGAWNTGGSCTGKAEPIRPGKLVENEFTNMMHEKQMTGFNRAKKKQTNRSKIKLMDVTEVFSYRHDGHPGPYRSSDPNKLTKRGPDGRPPPQDCLHWCMPGPVDTWNEIMAEIIRREYEKS